METTGKKRTKTLDTLVPDINNLLTNLGDGKKLEVSDEQLNKFLINIKDSIVYCNNTFKKYKFFTNVYTWKTNKTTLV